MGNAHKLQLARLVSITTLGASDFPCGVGVMMGKTERWKTRHVVWLRHLLKIPVFVINAILSGLAPSMVAEFVLFVGRSIGRYLFRWVGAMSGTWLGDPWVWCLPGIALFVWWCRFPLPMTIGHESEDPPVRKQSSTIPVGPNKPSSACSSPQEYRDVRRHRFGFVAILPMPSFPFLVINWETPISH